LIAAVVLLTKLFCLAIATTSSALVHALCLVSDVGDIAGARVGRGDEIDRRLPSAIRLAIVKTFSRRGGARVSSRFGGAITMFLQNRRTDWVHVRARGQFPQLRFNSIGTPDPLTWNYAAAPNTNICS
jgi:hypothetical protein